jgi:hypothetical protein
VDVLDPSLFHGASYRLCAGPSRRRAP